MSARIALPERLDLPAAGPLAEELRAARGRDLILDASATTHLGTPGLQVLLSAALSWSEDGHALSIAGLGEGPLAQLSLIGLAPDDLSTHSDEE
jgi:anti-anti-sigma regulatory factor